MIIKYITFLFSILLMPQAAAEMQIVGKGKWKFEFQPNGIALPEKHIANVQDYHGVAVDSKGRVYIAYYSNKQSNETRALARFNYTPHGKTPFTFDRFLGDSSWVDGRVHGLNIILNDRGEERLLLVYNKNKVILCDLDGKVNVDDSWIIKHGVLGKASDGNRSRLSKHLGVYDGYRSNILHEMHLHDGTRTGLKHGGKGSHFDQTSTAHGIGVDLQGRYVVADRGNKRLVWQNPSFEPIRSTKNKNKQLQLATPDLEVCNVSFSADGSAVIPALNARIGFLRESSDTECGYEMDGFISMPPKLVKRGYDGIHDANFSIDKKYLIVAVWQRDKKIPPRLFTLRRIQTTRQK